MEKSLKISSYGKNSIMWSGMRHNFRTADNTVENSGESIIPF